MRIKNESGVVMGCDFSSLEDWQADQQEYCIATANRGLGRTTSSILKQIEHVNVNSAKDFKREFLNENVFEPPEDFVKVFRMIEQEAERRRRKEIEESIIMTCQVTGQPYEVVKGLYEEMNNRLLYAVKSCDVVRRMIERLSESTETLSDGFKELEKQFESVDDAILIEQFERRKEHCKNYLELKQIDRKLNELKRNKGKRKRGK